MNKKYYIVCGVFFTISSLSSCRSVEKASSSNASIYSTDNRSNEIAGQENMISEQAQGIARNLVDKVYKKANGDLSRFVDEVTKIFANGVLDLNVYDKTTKEKFEKTSEFRNRVKKKRVKKREYDYLFEELISDERSNNFLERESVSELKYDADAEMIKSFRVDLPSYRYGYKASYWLRLRVIASTPAKYAIGYTLTINACGGSAPSHNPSTYHGSLYTEARALRCARDTARVLDSASTKADVIFELGRIQIEYYEYRMRGESLITIDIPLIIKSVSLKAGA